MAASRAQFEVDGGPALIAVIDRLMPIGRRVECDVSLLEQSVSTAHSLFDLDGRWFLRDLSSLPARSSTATRSTMVKFTSVRASSVTSTPVRRRHRRRRHGFAGIQRRWSMSLKTHGTAPLLDVDRDEALDDELAKADAAAQGEVQPCWSSQCARAMTSSIPLDFDELMTPADGASCSSVRGCDLIDAPKADAPPAAWFGRSRADGRHPAGAAATGPARRVHRRDDLLVIDRPTSTSPSAGHRGHQAVGRGDAAARDSCCSPT